MRLILTHLSAHASAYVLVLAIVLTAVLLLRLTVWRRKAPPSNELFR